MFKSCNTGSIINFVLVLKQINLFSLRNTKLKMATSIVYSCQLRYNLPYINKSVMRPLYITSLYEVNGDECV